jgi:hypothetical protein
MSKYKLRKGDNNIKIVIKRKLKDLQYMFYKCSNLKNIDELKYLVTKYVNNFEYMFFGCSSFSDSNHYKNEMYQMVIIFHLCSMVVHLCQI